MREIYQKLDSVSSIFIECGQSLTVSSPKSFCNVSELNMFWSRPRSRVRRSRAHRSCLQQPMSRQNMIAMEPGSRRSISFVTDTANAMKCRPIDMM